MSAAPARPSREPGWTGWLPMLLVPLALVCDPAAALPTRTYFFRDFTVTFLPLRLFVAQELRAWRFPFWNPYVFEGTFQLPTFYPPDLLHALWPSPVFVSWLLTAHLPLAAVAAYWLARELGATRSGGFAAGCVFALGGFGLSCLNLYVFLQALALAPFVVGLLRRAAGGGGRRIVLASAILALATSTLAVEFVAQAVVLGIALGFVEGGARSLPRLGLSIALGIGLAGAPALVLLGLLPETARGAGFAPDVVLGNSVHPAVLLQALMPHLFGLPAAPAEAWWGGRFFSKGAPYFLSLYCGPLALGLAALGATRFGRGVRVAVGVCSALGLWYALGALGGLAPLALHLPLASALRFPSKALLLPYLGLALAAGFGADRLLEDDGAWRRLAALTGGFAGVAVAVAIAIAIAPAGLVAWTGVWASFWPALRGVAAGDAAACGLVALATLAVALAVKRGLVRPGPAVALVAAVLAADLARASTGLNRQVDASFFTLLPELAALPVRDPEGGRVFSYGLDRSPAFRGVLGKGGRELTLGAFYSTRQELAPYTNMLDRIESPEGKDLTAFAPREAELPEELYEPRRVAELVPWLRNAAVTRVLSVDPLSHPALRLLGVVPMGLPGLAVHAYRLDGSWPRAYLACRVLAEPEPSRALLRPYRADYDPRRDVALAAPTGDGCRKGEVWGRGAVPGRERFETNADGAGYLVVRASYARGWRALVDDRPAAVLRADGKHLAVALAPGRHDLELRYVPPGWTAGIALSLVSLFVSAALWIRPGGRSLAGSAR